MASLLPHPTYAEDQPHAHTLLHTHVTHRTFQTGALLGLALTPPLRLLTRTTPLLSTAPALRSTGIGALIGLALGPLMTLGRMRGKEEIEWKDRAWRLRGNAGQVEVEGWSVVGSVVGAAAVAGKGRGLRVVGGAGVGSLVGVLGYLGWRYGVRGARRGEI